MADLIYRGELGWGGRGSNITMSSVVYCERLDHHSHSRRQELSGGGEGPDTLLKDEIWRISPPQLEPTSDDASLEYSGKLTTGAPIVDDHENLCRLLKSVCTHTLHQGL